MTIPTHLEMPSSPSPNLWNCENGVELNFAEGKLSFLKPSLRVEDRSEARGHACRRLVALFLADRDEE